MFQIDAIVVRDGLGLFLITNDGLATIQKYFYDPLTLTRCGVSHQGENKYSAERRMMNITLPRLVVSSLLLLTWFTVSCKYHFSLFQLDP